jgi:sulfur-oxidizing protein SoxX
MRKNNLFIAAAAVAIVAGCAAVTPPPDYDAAVAKMMAASFSDKSIAKVDRLQQDDVTAACSKVGNGELPEATEKALQAENLKTVKLPADGRYLGDWKVGEKLAQDGKGMTWAETTTDPRSNGGSCYNCHQLSPAEISFGTIGPSLYHYGRNRGVSDPGSATAQPIVAYTWGKLYNAKAYNACSTMPRFGHAKLLDEAQLKDLMALLLDPKSPVNQ